MIKSTNYLTNDIYIPLLVCVLIFSCDSKKNVFTSDFNSSETRTWIGSEYWTNPIQDWQISNGELECLVSKPNRNVHILTKKLNTIKGDLNMTVHLRLFSKDTVNQSKNWIGFSIVSKGEFKDYRDNAIFGKGLSVGITTKENLFIDKIPQNNVTLEC